MQSVISCNLQDVFHMGTHWLQACGIFRKIMDPYMNVLPDLPLKTLRGSDEALQPAQLIMIFFIWSFGLSCALVSFVIELAVARLVGENSYIK